MLNLSHRARAQSMSAESRGRGGSDGHSVSVPLHRGLVDRRGDEGVGVVAGDGRAIGGHDGGCGALLGLRWPSG